MAKLIGISGSLRKGSFNTKLLRAATALVPEGSSLDIASIEGIPLYNGDEEAELGLPEAVVALKDRIAAADGLVIATPEYNGSMPGVLKNALDYCSRGGDMARVFGGRFVAVMGATPGGRGTVLAQAAWHPVWRQLGLHLYNGKSLYAARASKLFDGEGALTDDDTKARLKALLEGFCRDVDKLRG